MHDRHPQVQGGIVDEISGGKVVRPVDDDVVSRHDAQHVLAGEPFGVRLDLHIRVERRDRIARRVDLELPHPVGIVKNLALQVRDLNHVEVDDADGADSGRGKIQGGG